MKKFFKIGILGEGRIGRAAAHYFKKIPAAARVIFLKHNREIKGCDLLVGALAGELGEVSLRLALRYRKNLIDISDVDPPFYLKSRKEIEKAGITVIPGCGFSPGLVNFILGYEMAGLDRIETIEVKAGSLSRRKFFYPFLWCFEDLILEHRIPSWQKIAGRKRKFPPFAGFKKERFFGIDAESYFCASGFENILNKGRVRNFFCRVVRPQGFREFFGFLQGQGFLQKDNFCVTKNILEGERHDNLTFAGITFSVGKSNIRWELKSFSRRSEKLNSMQKITACVPAVVGRMVLAGQILKGLWFMEDLARNDKIFSRVLAEARKAGISVKRDIK